VKLKGESVKLELSQWNWKVRQWNWKCVSETESESVKLNTNPNSTSNWQFTFSIACCPDVKLRYVKLRYVSSMFRTDRQTSWNVMSGPEYYKLPNCTRFRSLSHDKRAVRGLFVYVLTLHYRGGYLNFTGWFMKKYYLNRKKGAEIWNKRSFVENKRACTEAGLEIQQILFFRKYINRISVVLFLRAFSLETRGFKS
jgi:hypothetical protein